MKAIFVLHFNNTVAEVISVILRQLALARTKQRICFRVLVLKQVSHVPCFIFCSRILENCIMGSNIVQGESREPDDFQNNI